MLQLFSTPEERTPHCKGQKYCPIGVRLIVIPLYTHIDTWHSTEYFNCIVHYHDNPDFKQWLPQQQIIIIYNLPWQIHDAVRNAVSCLGFASLVDTLCNGTVRVLNF